MDEQEQEKEKKRKNPGIRKRHTKKRGYKEIKWWKECRKLAESLLSKKAEKDKEKEARKRRSRQPKVQWTLGKSGGWFLILMGGHDMLRKVDRQGDVLIWCRKCSGYARQRMDQS